MVEAERHLPAEATNPVLTYEEIIQMPDVQATRTLGEQDRLILSKYRKSRDRVEGERREAHLTLLGSKPDGVNL